MSHGSTIDKIDPANDFTMTTDSKHMLSVGPDESHLQSATIAIALKLDNVKKVFEPHSGSAKKIVKHLMVSALKLGKESLSQ